MKRATIAISEKRARISVAPKDQRTYNGRVYHSKAEARKAAALDVLVRAKKISGWKAQGTIVLAVNGKTICLMRPDFVVNHNDGRQQWLEVKGHETEVYKLKRKLLAALFPELWYTVEYV